MNDPKQLEAQFKPKELKVVTSDIQVLAARFSPCGRFLAGGDYEGKVRRWKAEGDGFDVLPSIEAQGSWIQGLAFNKSGETIYEADTWGRLAAWKHAGEKPERLWQVDAAHDGWIRDLAVSADGTLLASGGADKTVRVWNAADGKPVKELKGDSADVYCVAFHADRKTLFSADFKGTVRRWDLASGAVVKTYAAPLLTKSDRLQDIGGIRAMRLSDDGKTLYVGGTLPANGGNVQGVPTLLTFDVESGEQTKKVDLGAVGDVYVTDIVNHPAGFLMIASSGNPGQGKFHFLRPGDDKPFFMQSLSNVHSIGLHPGGKRFAVATTNAGSNGNGRNLDKEGKYPANKSPIHIFDFPA
jgi:WD40 repeat protein